MAAIDQIRELKSIIWNEKEFDAGAWEIFGWSKEDVFFTSFNEHNPDLDLWDMFKAYVYEYDSRDWEASLLNKFKEEFHGYYNDSEDFVKEYLEGYFAGEHDVFLNALYNDDIFDDSIDYEAVFNNIMMKDELYSYMYYNNGYLILHYY